MYDADEPTHYVCFSANEDPVYMAVPGETNARNGQTYERLLFTITLTADGSVYNPPEYSTETALLASEYPVPAFSPMATVMDLGNMDYTIYFWVKWPTSDLASEYFFNLRATDQNLVLRYESSQVQVTIRNDSEVLFTTPFSATTTAVDSSWKAFAITRRLADGNFIYASRSIVATSTV